MGRTLALLVALLAWAMILPASGAPAQNSPFAGHHDSSQPIHITADKLEVQQDNQVAIFTGHVDAVQGEVHLRSDKLKIYYRQKAPVSGAENKTKSTAKGENGAKPVQDPADTSRLRAKAANPGTAPFSGGAITHIVADGHVFVSQPGQTAAGDHGVYDVTTRVITLTGTSVILTRGKNVLHGQKAVMNLDTGISTLVPTAGGRVQGLFVPEKNDQSAPAPTGKHKTQ